MFSIDGYPFLRPCCNPNRHGFVTHAHLSLRFPTVNQVHPPMESIRDLLQFIKERKKWWLAPIILVMLLLGILLVIGGGSAVAPFIYTLF